MSKFTVSDAGPGFQVEEIPKRVVQKEDSAAINVYDVQEEFQEKYKKQDVDEYERSGSDPGLIVIFNQLNFDDNSHSTRTGSNRDVNELIVTFGRLGFNVNQNYVFTDYTKDQIVTTLDKISKDDHTHRNCLIVVMLTHGNKDNLLFARDKYLETSDIWTPFTIARCETLANKPKFFIFQACKGDNFSQVDTSETDIISKVFFRSSLERDMLVAFSAVEGNRSYRHIFNGTWFIQEMCRNFTAFGRRDDVVSLLTRTSKCVSSNYFHISECKTRIKKQMPLFISTLTKRFYLTRSKDRNNILAYLDEQEQLCQTLQMLKDKVDALYQEYEKKFKYNKKK